MGRRIHPDVHEALSKVEERFGEWDDILRGLRPLPGWDSAMRRRYVSPFFVWVCFNPSCKVVSAADSLDLRGTPTRPDGWVAGTLAAQTREQVKCWGYSIITVMFCSLGCSRDYYDPVS